MRANAASWAPEVVAAAGDTLGAAADGSALATGIADDIASGEAEAAELADGDGCAEAAGAVLGSNPRTATTDIARNQALTITLADSSSYGSPLRA